MSKPLDDIEQRLTDALRDVSAQTWVTPGGVERLKAALTDDARPDTRSRTGARRLAVTAAVLVLGMGGGIWAVSAVNGPNQATSADAIPADVLRVPDLVPATGPLYLLPPEGTDLSQGVNYTDDPPVDVGSGLVLGHLTDTGFDDVALIAHLISGPTFGKDAGSTVEIAGRELYQPSYGDGADGTWTAAEELPDGTWIEYTTVAGGDILAEAVAGTTVVDGQLEWATEPGGLEELGRTADLQGSDPTWLSTPTGNQPASSGFLLQTSIYNPDLGLAFAGVYGPAERTTVDGRPAFLVRPRSDLGLPSLVLTWATSSGHIVLLVGQGTEDELRTFATNLQSVDRQTWEATLSPFDADTGD